MSLSALTSLLLAGVALLAIAIVLMYVVFQKHIAEENSAELKRLKSELSMLERIGKIENSISDMNFNYILEYCNDCGYKTDCYFNLHLKPWESCARKETIPDPKQIKIINKQCQKCGQSFPSLDVVNREYCGQCLYGRGKAGD
jgi:ribosomal protein S27AE